jgi:glutamyl-Q tRNA(Asp) synthetase
VIEQRAPTNQGSTMTRYRGRFAPSPTGPLHYGSLLAAVISYLDAKSSNGDWLVRIEDIDGPRTQPNADKSILACLSSHGLISDFPTTYQSKHYARYEIALGKLQETGFTYRCPCSRMELAENQNHSPRCISQDIEGLDCAIKFRATNKSFNWQDGIYGAHEAVINRDFVLKRKDGLYAYQLAVVVDDIEQQITQVIRGADLVESTPMQLALYDALGFAPPIYSHFPLMTNEQGQKLSKQNLSPSVNNHFAVENIREIVRLLGIEPLSEQHCCKAILTDASKRWSRSQLSSIDHFDELIR